MSEPVAIERRDDALSYRNKHRNDRGQYIGVGTLEERFWAKVDRRGEDDCWPWMAARNSTGYGQFWDGARQWPAHRWIYVLLHGDIGSLAIDHLCRTHECVNPRHLEAVTDRENILRGKGLAAQNAQRTTCTRGHQFSPENTRLEGRRRICRECKQITGRIYDRRRRAQRV